THRSGGDMYAQPQVTNDGKVHLAAGDLAWRSPDGAHLAHVDRRGRLSIRTKGGAVRKVARGVEPAQLSWSPNSVLLAFPLARGARGTGGRPAAAARPADAAADVPIPGLDAGNRGDRVMADPGLRPAGRAAVRRRHSDLRLQQLLLRLVGRVAARLPRRRATA